MNKLFFVTSILFLFSSVLFGVDYKTYKNEQTEQFSKYQKSISNDFILYKKVYDDSLKEYKVEISRKWPVSDISTNYKWVEYSSNYDSKKIIDYDKGYISISVIAANSKEAEKKLIKMFDDLYKYDAKEGFNNDILEQKISQKFDKNRSNILSNEKLIGDMITKDQQENLKKTIVAPKLEEIKYNENNIYKVELRFPKNAILQKEKLYKTKIKEQSDKLNIKEKLILGIIKNESSFNPLAKSHVPAFGLMQIVPQSAGIDAYNHLYGEKKLLDSEYLFDPNNNIMIGSTYLSILYYKHLKDIKDQQSRVYCTIASYNTGSSNVARAFGSSTKISQAMNEINSMSSEDVYVKLINDLPYDETKKYIARVKQSMDEYAKMLQNGTL